MVIDKRIGQNVAQIDGFDAPQIVGMVLDQQPADVRVEEAAPRVVRIGVRVAELVVRTVVTYPAEYVVLKDRKRPL